MNELLDISLPKWPQCIIVGESLEPKQALEIIRRTDNFFLFGGGNNDSWNQQVDRILQIPQPPESLQGTEEFRFKTFQEYWKAKETWQEQWGYIHTEYIHNSWISNAYVGGPCGWCHPDGTILFGENIGKWPEVQDVIQDWEAVLKAFPFLTINCILMDREHHEKDPKPLVALKIRKGEVKLVGPEEILKPEFWEGMAFKTLTEVQKKIYTNQKISDALFQLDYALGVLSRDQREVGLPLEVIVKWGERIKK